MAPLLRPSTWLPFVFAATAAHSTVHAAPPPTDEGEVEHIRITEPRTERAAPAETWSLLPEDRARRADARDAGELLRRAPGALVQTNSRGETLVYLRNTGERQVSIFFDGAPLEIPWDHRFDLRLLPSAAVGRTEVARGPLSNRYGANVSGGAIFLEPPEVEEEAQSQLRIEGGSAGYLRIEGAAGLSYEDASIWVGAERTERGGEPLSRPLPFSQDPSALRTNTDARRSSALARGTLRLPRAELSLSLLYGSASYGIAPESHLDPAQTPVRYWRYPNSELVMAVARLEAHGRAWAADAILWGQAFHQTLESYASARYQQRTEQQRDRDESLGARARISRSLGAHQLSLSTSGRVARHRARRGTDAQEETFEHALMSAGTDYLLRASQWSFRAGGGLDAFEAFAAAGRPSPSTFFGWNLTAGGRYDLTTKIQLHVAAGSRARLPTSRELFGTALDRFVLNPNLHPERITSFEVGARYATRALRLELIPFVSWTEDTLDQEQITVDEKPLRRRINLDGHLALGAELLADVQLASWLRASGHLLWTDLQPQGSTGVRLAERPAIQAFGEVTLGESRGPELAAEVMARSEIASAVDGGFQEVPGAALLNLRLAWRFWDADLGALELFGRIDNLLDARLEPQLGLPEPGRWLRLGGALRL